MSEQFVMHCINNLTLSEKAAMDIGANIGKYTVPLSKKFKKVYAVEPHPDNIALLKQNTNGCPNIEVFEGVISNKTGTTTLNVNKTNMGGHTLNENVSKHKEWGFYAPEVLSDIKSITLDEFCKDKDIELLKIDIEGAEDFIFEGATETLKKPNINILIEVHNEVDTEKLYKIFESNGFRAYCIGMVFNSGRESSIRLEVVPSTKFIADEHYLLKKD